MSEPYSFSSQVEPVYPLPNARIVLVLGVLSVVGSCCFGLAGLILGIIALVLSHTDLQVYRQKPHQFTPASYNNLQTGRTCAVIGVILSIILGIYLFFSFLL